MNASVGDIRRFLASRNRKEISDSSLTRAGVLIPLFKEQNAWHLLLTKRSDQVEHHKGQVSFPGGAMESGDNDITETALRESQEEIGLPRAAVEVLGLFDDHETPTGFIMTPVVGYLARFPLLTPKKEEVVRILRVPVSLFLDGKHEKMVPLNRLGKIIDVYFYDYEEDEIWGATARISRDFLRALSGYVKNPL